MTALSGKAILIVEDSILIRDMLVEFVESLGMVVSGVADSYDKALASAYARRPAIILMDVRLKGNGDGIQAGREIHGDVGCPVIYLTGALDKDTIERIEQSPRSAVLFKPISTAQLAHLMERMLSS